MEPEPGTSYFCRRKIHFKTAKLVNIQETGLDKILQRPLQKEKKQVPGLALIQDKPSREKS